MLLAVTAFAAGLTISVALNVSASNSSSAGAEAPLSSNAPDFAPASAPAVAPGDEQGDGYFQLLRQFLGSDGRVGPMLANLTGFLQNNVQGMQEFARGLASKAGLGNGPMGGGEVSKIEGNKLTLKSGRVVSTTNITAFGDANGNLALSDLKVGDNYYTIFFPI